MASTTWLQYYADLAGKAGTNPVKTAVLTENAIFTDVSKRHLDKPDRFRSTISGNAPASIIIIPVGGGKAQILHHGTLFAKGIGMDPLALFVTGNRASAPIKIVDVEEACQAIGGGLSASTRAKPINTPTSAQFYDDTLSPATFKALKATDKNNPLVDRPNHLLIHPRIFEIAEGAQSVTADELAWKIIESVNFAASDTAEEIAEFEKQKDDHYVLLAYLWMIAKDLGKSVTITDVGDADDALDNKCVSIRAQITGGGGSNTGGGGGGGTPINVNLDTTVLAATNAALLTSVNALNTSLLASDADKKEKKSVLHGMAPNSRRLFERICTTDIRKIAPIMPPFLKSLIGERNPSLVSNHLKSITKPMKGTFLEGAFCRFLAKGYVSQKDNLVPGGFTIFMFLPKECEKVRDGYKENVEQIRQLWSQKMDDETIDRLARTDLFACENVHHLEIQLETALLVLEHMSVPGGCATTSLYLSHRWVRRHSALIARLTKTDPLLPVRIAYLIDLELQKWFSLICDHEGPMARIRKRDANFHEEQLATWLYGIEMHKLPNVHLPAELGGQDYAPIIRQVSIESDEETDPPKKKARKSPGSLNRTSCKGRMNPKWKLPKGVSYDAVFTGDNLKGWPTIKNRSGQSRSVCLKFQSTGVCAIDCGFSHAYCTEIEPNAAKKITDRMKKVYASVGA